MTSNDELRRLNPGLDERGIARLAALSQIDGDIITLHRTCYACPEQYDARRAGRLVGYLRLRHGHFTVQAVMPDDPGPGWGPAIYEAEPEGDGIFDESEREGYLNAAVSALSAFWCGWNTIENEGEQHD